jgi:hypothetical protein
MLICQNCRSEVEPSDPAVVYAVEMVDLDDAGADAIEGLGVLFHERCYPVGSSDYRRKPMPEIFLPGSMAGPCNPNATR